VGCDAVCWQGETTLRARAREEEQRRQRTASQLNRVRSARYKLDLALEAKKVRIRAVFLEARERPGEISGLSRLGAENAVDRTWPGLTAHFDSNRVVDAWHLDFGVKGWRMGQTV
jgi:hypothetical protein